MSQKTGVLNFLVSKIFLANRHILLFSLRKELEAWMEFRHLNSNNLWNGRSSPPDIISIFLQQQNLRFTTV
jgi:hypothetical protein